MELSLAEDLPGTLQRPRLDAAAGVLLGSRCPNCSATSWPSRAICHNCGKPSKVGVPLPNTGRLLSCTNVWVPREGLTNPYTLGQVEIEGGALLFAHVRGLPEEARVPIGVRLVIPGPGEPSPIAFWFEPS